MRIFGVDDVAQLLARGQELRASDPTPATMNRDVPRSLFCTCGWGAIATSLHAANTRIALHLSEATESCDHAVNIEDATS